MHSADRTKLFFMSINYDYKLCNIVCYHGINKSGLLFTGTGFPLHNSVFIINVINVIHINKATYYKNWMNFHVTVLFTQQD